MKIKWLNKNKFFVLITIILILNYLMICYHVDRNPLDIIPSWPISDNREQITVYLPDIDGTTIFSEKRLIEKNNEKEIFIKKLVKFVIKGSNFENTKSAVPIEGNVRKVWVYNNKCIVDFYYETTQKNVKAIKNQDVNFKNALTKTIKENVKSIQEVILLVKGIPGKNLW